ncbi:MAG: CTP-dependent riboflavin kinase [Candidatus Odinarchaeum yellowstonii]|uniref:Riboflavin kinase n=1 Tax=Odinarchaeota yellowstonii (strain LCB_4) TaxID=1841599 RepID=A0AAF0D320_ODILC|nr:MAG: CTP-dependent riboflavin kinase [Candidatus Odinarchaeum yellowstonii]
MEAKLLLVLLSIAELGNGAFTSTTILSGRIGVSQQSASRYLKLLEKEGLISRKITRRGQVVTLTKAGLDELRGIYNRLKVIFGEVTPLYVIKGVVFTGFGEGSYYMSKKGYLEQFEKQLGFKPFPGTLNIKLIDENDIKAKRELQGMPGKLIKSFKEDDRIFGDVKCFPALINGKVEGAVILIKRTHYGDDVLEVISKFNLREKLSLKDGDIVKLTVNLSMNSAYTL